jgi:carbon dioxide concentrating mechanism protein CcmN
MSVPPLRLGNSFESYISGEVIISPSAVIALGVILQAAPNSKIIIGAGVCVGMGSILQVHAGSLEIESGASLGAGFLMVGAGKIGANACIGAATTVFECSVASGQVVPPGSILLSHGLDIVDALPVEADHSTNGNNGKDSINQNSIADGKLTQPSSQTVVDDVKTDLWSNRVPTMQYFRSKSQSQLINSTTLGNNTDNSQNQDQDQAEDQPEDQPSKEPTQVSTIQAFNEPAPETANNFAAHIYGQGNVQRLLVTLFPHRQSLNKSISDDSSD